MMKSSRDRLQEMYRQIEDYFAASPSSQLHQDWLRVKARIESTINRPEDERGFWYFDMEKEINEIASQLVDIIAEKPLSRPWPKDWFRRFFDLLEMAKDENNADMPHYKELRLDLVLKELKELLHEISEEPFERKKAECRKRIIASSVWIYNEYDDYTIRADHITTPELEKEFDDNQSIEDWRSRPLIYTSASALEIVTDMGIPLDKLIPIYWRKYDSKIENPINTYDDLGSCPLTSHTCWSQYARLINKEIRVMHHAMSNARRGEIHSGTYFPDGRIRILWWNWIIFFAPIVYDEHISRLWLFRTIEDAMRAVNAICLAQKLSPEQRELLTELDRATKSKRARKFFKSRFLRDIEFMASSMDPAIQALERKCHEAGIPEKVRQFVRY